jgi:aminocarboxymuconate-semialdehyde decarboxylase
LEALSYLVGLVGPDRVMLGSDFCFDMGVERPVESVAALASLSKDERQLILGLNACRLLGLEPEAA